MTNYRETPSEMQEASIKKQIIEYIQGLIDGLEEELSQLPEPIRNMNPEQFLKDLEEEREEEDMSKLIPFHKKIRLKILQDAITIIQECPLSQAEQKISIIASQIPTGIISANTFERGKKGASRRALRDILSAFDVHK